MQQRPMSHSNSAVEACLCFQVPWSSKQGSVLLCHQRWESASSSHEILTWATTSSKFLILRL